ncbi:hypothetical protein [Actinomadura sp. 6K520]|uniref:hypothetical protein n=1 Tax=Actinomadura sp. 6K520 TaxID=2530364 RepID=UPI001052A688|nr:hypothetical protein [Actinomadura sp. 6K520]TDE32122.1 hypothetical protein E1289_16595 [Actinomadura sp. 6K520]
MPPELMYVAAMVHALRTRARNLTRADRRDVGLTTLEVAIIAGGLALLAAGVITAIGTAIENRKGNIR